MSIDKHKHDGQSAVRFLENLYEEILISSDINDIKDPNVLKKLRETIEYFKNMTNCFFQQ